MDLNPLVDLEINTKDLTSEFRRLSLLLFRYYTAKADAEREYDRCKATYEEIKSHVYKALRTDQSKKHTEKSLEAEIETNEDVNNTLNLLLDSKRNLATLIGAVESMKAKKDMLIQLGADARKE